MYEYVDSFIFSWPFDIIFNKLMRLLNKVFIIDNLNYRLQSISSFSNYEGYELTRSFILFASQIFIFRSQSIDFNKVIF